MERPDFSVAHDGNGEKQLSPKMLARIETALESERRQRELLERRLLEAERRLQSALAAVGAADAPDSGLLQLKSQLALEAQEAAGRALLEHNLLELELVANAEAEALTSPAQALPVRVIHAVLEPEAPPPPHVDAPSADEALAAAQMAIDAAEARANESAQQVIRLKEELASIRGPKDFNDKLAAAQLAIDAAEARASHNALQVRKLTEELAAARAEQIRLSAQMRSVSERFETAGKRPPAAKKRDTRRDQPSGPALDLAIEPLAPETTPPEPSANLEDLASALSDWGAPGDAPAPPAAAPEFDEAAALEDALQGFGDLGEPAPLQAPSDSDLEDALSAFGDAADEPPAAAPETSPPADNDALVSVLEGWGDLTGDSAPAGSGLENALEVDTISRLDTADTPVEQRVAEALGAEPASASRQDSHHESALDDLEAGEPVEDEARWSPTPVRPEPEDAVAVVDWATPEPEERISPVHHDDLVETIVDPPARPSAWAPGSTTLAALDEAETHREDAKPSRLSSREGGPKPPPLPGARRVYIEPEPELAAAAAPEPISEPEPIFEPQPIPEPEPIPEPVAARATTPPPQPEPAPLPPAEIATGVEEAATPVEDFEPDLLAASRRRAPAAAENRGDRAPGRNAMISALQRFIGE